MLNKDQTFSSRYAVIRDKRSRDNKGGLYLDREVWENSAFLDFSLLILRFLFIVYARKRPIDYSTKLDHAEQLSLRIVYEKSNQLAHIY